MILAALFSSASAQQICSEPMSRIQLGAALGDIDSALAASELLEAREKLDDISGRLPCLDEVVDRKLLALFARQNAIVYFHSQELDDATRWGQVSRLVMADLAWDEKRYPQDNPARTMIDSIPLPEMLVMSGGLAAPKGGGVFVSGRFAPRPESWPDVPVLVQVFDRSQARVESFWQEGTSFPENILSERAEDLPPPSWWMDDGTSLPAPSPRPKPTPTSKPPRPPGEGPPIVPIAASLSLGVLSAASYALAAQSASSFREDPHSSEELTSLRTRTNLLVLASGTSLAGAVGFGVSAVFVSAGGITVRF